MGFLEFKREIIFYFLIRFDNICGWDCVVVYNINRGYRKGYFSFGLYLGKLSFFRFVLSRFVFFKLLD